MVRITEELVRKRAEHNEREIGTLEEISLHQEDIEKIEHLQHWCKDLKILLLQSNLISKIENLKKLKKVEYINLAVNNIEKIENLEGCESLQKLDLTLNFIGELTSVENLQNNLQLEDLYLTGNPCTDYKGYREYVITALPQIKRLDNREILRSERIQALQKFDIIRKYILQEQDEYRKKRERQKLAAEIKKTTKSDKNMKDNELYVLEDEERFWSQKSEHTPETRTEIANHIRKSKELKEKKDSIKQKRTIKLFNKDGKPNNINEPKIEFKLIQDDENNSFILELHIYRYLDISSVDIDVQPTYVKVMIKQKVFQLVLDEEIKTDECSAQRSKTTGHLVIKMPKVKVKKITALLQLFLNKILSSTDYPSNIRSNVHYINKVFMINSLHNYNAYYKVPLHDAKDVIKSKKLTVSKLLPFMQKEHIENKGGNDQRREFLEIGRRDTDYTKICENTRKEYEYKGMHINKIVKKSNIKEKIPPSDFIDDKDVPLLE
ncbi:touch insensitive larva B [Lycorma delicatula]|uniref:touch insensitive larva B n=1 Tax=Lycorma delicatula TaxID=130591 RepID=UPI003F50E58F